MSDMESTIEEEVANIKAKYITNVEVSVAEIISYIKHRVGVIGSMNHLTDDEKRMRLDEFFFLIDFIENGEW